MIQSGDGDWIINHIPSGIESQVLQDALIQHRTGVLNGPRAFYLAGTSPPNKKCHLRVLRASVVKNLFWTRVKKLIRDQQIVISASGDAVQEEENG